LVTGFEPFGGERINPSARVAQALAGPLAVAGRTWQVHALQLPCVFAQAAPQLLAALRERRYSIVVALGQASGRASLSMERVAINLIDARIADNAGQQPLDARVVPRAREAYFTTLPVKAMAQAARQAGAAAEVSLSAGSFVCNAVFFALMHALMQQHRDMPSMGLTRGGFVHLPNLPTQVRGRRPPSPSMAQATMIKGLRAALVAAAMAERDLHTVEGRLA
jgi:pyroglutamyl-peptidase